MPRRPPTHQPGLGEVPGRYPTCSLRYRPNPRKMPLLLAQEWVRRVCLGPQEPDRVRIFAAGGDLQIGRWPHIRPTVRSIRQTRQARGGEVVRRSMFDLQDRRTDRQTDRQADIHYQKKYLKILGTSVTSRSQRVPRSLHATSRNEFRCARSYP